MHKETKTVHPNRTDVFARKDAIVFMQVTELYFNYYTGTELYLVVVVSSSLMCGLPQHAKQKQYVMYVIVKYLTATQAEREYKT